MVQQAPNERIAAETNVCLLLQLTVMNRNTVSLPSVLQTDKFSRRPGAISSHREDVVDHPEQCKSSISCISPSAISSGPCRCDLVCGFWDERHCYISHILGRCVKKKRRKKSVFSELLMSCSELCPSLSIRFVQLNCEIMETMEHIN